MSNLNTPNGFTPLDLKSWTRYYIQASDTTEYRPGDVVASSGGTDAAGVVGVSKHSGTGAARGVIVSIDPGLPATRGMQANGQLLYVPALKTRDYYVWVNDEPTAKFMVVDDSIAPSKLVAANVGSFVNFTPGTAPAANGSSTSALSSADFGGASGTGCLKVLQLMPGSTYGAAAIWIVQFAKHELAQGGGQSTPGISTLASATDYQSALVQPLANKIGAPAQWTAAGNTLAAGVAPTNGVSTYYVADSGVFAAPAALLADISSLRKDDVIQWSAALLKWVRYASANPAPLAVSSALTLLDAHDDMTLVFTGTPAVKLSAGRAPGFGCIMRGAFTWDATGLIVGSGITEGRTTTGSARAALVNTGADTYDIWGTQ